MLDELQAAEQAGADALAQWIDGCDDPRLRGGLRVIRARDTGHANLARARLADLGATPSATVSRSLETLCGLLAASGVSDRSKLSILIARFPARQGNPLAELLASIGEDDETRALLETIGDDDRTSLAWLREGSDLPAAAGASPPLPARLLHFVDALRAAEAASHGVIAAWADVTPHPGLRGGLRTIATREAAHATLLEARLRELGGVPLATVAEPVAAAARVRWGGAELSDQEKLDAFLARHPEAEGLATPIRSVADALHGDPETRELLRLIANAELDTMAWLRAYRTALGAA